jgi:hypothetical protein
MPLEELTIHEDLTYQEYPMKILDTLEKVTILKTKPLGKKKIS